MLEKMFEWVRRHKVAAGFIAAMLAVLLVLGIWAGVTWLQMEFRDPELQFRWALQERPETIGVTYHHSGSVDNPVEDYHAWHIARGWNGIGYHFNIRRNGDLEIGRPVWSRGSHAGSAGNDKTVGVVLSGEHHLYPPTEAQYETAAELHYRLEQKYGELEVFGHWDWMRTACPGRFTDLSKIERMLEEWRVPPLDEKRKTIEIEEVRGRVSCSETIGYLVVGEGRVYVPIRSVAERLGYDVSWDSYARIWRVMGEPDITARVTGQSGITLRDGRSKAIVEEIEGIVIDEVMAGYLFIAKGRVYVPVRWVAEELGYGVSWDGEKRIWGVQ